MNYLGEMKGKRTMMIPCPRNSRKDTNKKYFQCFFHVFRKAINDNPSILDFQVKFKQNSSK